MLALRLCRSVVVAMTPLALLGLSPAIGQPAASSADLVATLLPKVVNLLVTKYEKTPAAAGNMSSQSSIKEEKTQASGFIVDASGLIVTNRHAVSDAGDITVILDDGTHLQGRVVAAATQIDIALLQVEAGRPLPSVEFGDSDKLRPGDPVYVIGNPFGFGSTVTSGIVSALDRNVLGSEASSFIQIDAAINRGNSGGPVFDARGEVIAVGTALYSTSPDSGFVGIGYAIPGNDVRFTVDRLRANGEVRMGWIGAHVQPVGADIAAAVGLASPSGSIVIDVGENTPAAHGGVSIGDVILKVGDRAAPEPRVLNREIAESPIGSRVALTIWSVGGLQVLPVTIGEAPADSVGANAPKAEARQAGPVARDDLGLVVGPITEDIRRRLGLVAVPATGVAIREVVPNIVAAGHGLVPETLILNIDRQPVASPSDVQQRIDAARRERRSFILLLLEGQSGLHWVSLPLSA